MLFRNSTDSTSAVPSVALVRRLFDWPCPKGCRSRRQPWTSPFVIRRPSRINTWTTLVPHNIRWTPWALNFILDIKRIKQRAKKNHFLFAVSVRTKQRLWKNEPLPFCYWHEFLDLVYVFRWIVSLSDSFISVIYPHALDPGALTPLKVLRGIRLEPLRTVFTGRLPRTWNTLSVHLQNLNCSVAHFKKELFNYCLPLTKSEWLWFLQLPPPPTKPKTYKSMSIKCHTSRPLTRLLDEMCCWFFYQCLQALLCLLLRFLLFLMHCY